ncbi:hypothetical protein Vadar_025111 [Vaccinium darrowii]|uniref:Uncharacterized protein n=1 Tax=Vaccinium darrowii TaxID=229202 RepID=A0ACB7Z663_9ERIC|nr:hypothetical protein Vadar_025111 [Vaccinium darrowii]
MLSKKTIGSNYSRIMEAKTLTPSPPPPPQGSQPPPPPPGLTLFPSLKSPNKTLTFHQISVLLLTFAAYAAFHASRKPPSIVKSVLGPEIQAQNSTTSNGFDTGWAPFNGSHGAHRLGELDLAFLSAYSVVVGNWFGKSKRGLIMGVWSSHTSVGNIIGSVVASSVLGFGWGWSFVLPGVFIVMVGIVVYLFLVVSPENVGLELQGKEVEMNAEGVPLVDSEKVETGEVGLVQSENANSLGAIGFVEAWRLPNVAPFAFCLFFSKLVAYTFLYWLPFYIRHTAVGGVHLSHKTAGILSTVFDIGGVIGGILAGSISDALEARAVTSLAFLLLSIPALISYRIFGSISMVTNITLMFVSGLLVNGPYSLITTAVAADLGTQSLIKGNSRALATVTAIIDATGSVGAALGPLLAGYISTRGWNSVFFMLTVSISIAAMLLIHVVQTEIKEKMSQGKWLRWSIAAS